MLALLRHLLAIALLPGMVTVVVPIWVARRSGVTFWPPSSQVDLAPVALGAVVLLIGIVLFAASLRRFASEGHGTLAP